MRCDEIQTETTEATVPLMASMFFFLFFFPILAVPEFHFLFGLTSFKYLD